MPCETGVGWIGDPFDLGGILSFHVTSLIESFRICLGSGGGTLRPMQRDG